MSHPMQPVQKLQIFGLIEFNSLKHVELLIQGRAIPEIQPSRPEQDFIALTVFEVPEFHYENVPSLLGHVK